MATAQYLALDLGTTTIKGAVVDVGVPGFPRVETEPFPVLGAGPGGPGTLEIDPAVVVGRARAVLERLASHAPRAAGIVLTGQMGGLVLADGAGRALGPYVSWLDRRGMDRAPAGVTWFDALRAKLGPEGEARLGREVRPGIQLTFLFWLREHGALPPGAIPLPLADFVAASLCGARPVVEWTGAAGTLDVRSRDWPRDIFDRLGLGDLEWPEIVDYRRVVGRTRIGGRELTVHAAVGDHPCALVGMGLLDGELSVNVSTGSQVALLSGSPFAEEFQLRPFFDGAYLRTITNIPAGRALNAIVGLLGELGRAHGQVVDDPWPWLLKEAESVGAAGVEADLGFFPGAVSMPGAIRGLTVETLRAGNIVRACFEAMARYYDEFATRLEPGRSWSRVVLSGGLPQRSALLRRLILDRLGAEHRLVEEGEETLLGLRRVAQVVAGRAELVGTAYLLD